MADMNATTTRRVAGSVAELVDGATSREPFKTADSLSGATLERVVIDGERYVLKHLDHRTDWLLRATGDAGGRAVACWELGLYDAVAPSIDATVVGAARDPDAYGACALLMRDVSEQLVPAGDDPIDLATHRGFIDHLAEQHAAMWGWRDTVGLTPMANRFHMCSPALCATELARTGDARFGWALDAWRLTDRGLTGSVDMLLLPAMADMRAQVGRLTGNGFVADLGATQLRQLPRWLAAVRLRREKLPGSAARDRQLMDLVVPVQDAYLNRVGALKEGQPEPRALRRVRWLLEEYRVSLWAQHLGTPVPVSDTRLRKALAEADRG